MTQPTPAPDAPSAAKTPRPLLIASTLCWLCGIFALLVALAYAGDVLGTHRDWVAIGIATAALVLTVIYAVAGYALRRARRLGASLVVAAAACVVLALIATGQEFNVDAPSTILLVTNLFILGLVLPNWRHLSSR